MNPTPFPRLLARAVAARCPICGRGSLYHGPFQLRAYCPECGFRFHRALEYGAQGYLVGAVSLNIMITGAVPLAALVIIAATDAPVPLLVQYLASLLWAIIFPIVFHRLACAVWIALDLRLNPPAIHELAAAPPRVQATTSPNDHAHTS